MKIKIIIISVFFSMFLLSCGIVYNIDLYVGDLFDVLSENETLYTEAKVGFEYPGDSNKSEFISYISNTFRNAKKFKEETIDYSTYIFCNIEIPIIKSDNVDIFDKSEDLLIVSVNGKKDNLIFGFYFNKVLFNEISSYTEEIFYTDIEVKDIDMQLNLINDRRTDIKLNTGSVYINDEPVVYSKEFTIEGRQKVNIKLSDILKDALVNENEILFSSITE